jgi:hypothetical protein
VSPVCTVEAVGQDIAIELLQIDWLTIISTVLISAGMTLAAKRVD